MFGIKWNNKLKPSKVAKPDPYAKFDAAPKGFKQPVKAWDKKGWKSQSEKAIESKLKAMEDETV